MTYTEEDLTLLESQEKAFTIGACDSSLLLSIAETILGFRHEYDSGIALQIIREYDHLVMFQFVDDDKAERNLKFCAGKRTAELALGHSSAWGYVYSQIHVLSSSMGMVYSGGAFPLKDEEGHLLASILVSGLHEGGDHRLIVRGLAEALGRSCPEFPKPLA